MDVFSDQEKKTSLWLTGIFILVGFSLISVNHFESKILSGTRAFIEGEGKWSKAQKQASLSLIRYLITEDSTYYADFNKHLEVIEGDQIARNQLDLEDPDYDIVQSGFIQGGNLPENVPHLIWLYEKFSGFPQVERAISFWFDAEAEVEKLREIGLRARLLIEDDSFTQDSTDQMISRIYELDQALTVHEDNFTNEFSEIGNRVSIHTYWINVTVILILIAGVAYLIIDQFKKMSMWSRKIRQSEMRFRDVLTHSRDVIYQLDIKSGRYLYMSPSVKDITGYEIDEFTDGGISKVLSLTHPEDFGRMEHEVIDYERDNAEEKLKKDSEFRIKHKNGHYIWINNKRSLLRDEHGNAESIIGNVRDISDRKKVLEALDTSLKEKEMLLAEIHHRVKNNLSIVSSLVELQKNKSITSNDGDGLDEIQSRIKSIALVHEKLYQNETFAQVDIADYIEDLVDMIYKTFDSNLKKITLRKNLDSITLNIKKAVPLGLICNEMINNCYKYAFEGRKKGEIHVNLQVNEDKVHFSIADDGVGLPDNFEELKRKSLGMTLIQVLTKQLNGRLEYSSDNGACFAIYFDLNNEET